MNWRQFLGLKHIALIWDLDSHRMTLLVKRQDADRIVGHYYKGTSEDPARIRVDAFPTALELRQLRGLSASVTIS